MSNQHKNSLINDPKNALRITRIIWAAMLAGLIFFLITVAGIISQKTTTQLDPAAKNIMFLVSIFMIFTCIPLGLFIRGQIFKRCWQADVVTPRGYRVGNIIAFSLCESPGFFSLVVCIAAGSFWPYVIPAAVAIIMLILLWPNGRAMFPPPEV